MRTLHLSHTAAAHLSGPAIATLPAGLTGCVRLPGLRAAEPGSAARLEPPGLRSAAHHEALAAHITSRVGGHEAFRSLENRSRRKGRLVSGP